MSFETEVDAMQPSEYQSVERSFDIRKKSANQPRIIGPSHYHNAYELHYFLEGEGEFFVRNQIYNVRRGDLLFINTFELHKAISTTAYYEKFVIMYKPYLIQSLPGFQPPDIIGILDEKFNGTRLVSLPEDMKGKIRPLFEAMLEKSNMNNRYSTIYLRLLLSLLITYTGEYLESVKNISSHIPVSNKLIQDIIAFIDLNLDQDLSLDIISSKFNMDKYFLCRYFKKNTGLTVIEYVNQMRVIRSEKLLMQNKHTITEICFMVGFNNLTHFERTFKKYTGKSPRNYRKSLLTGQGL